MTKELDHEHSNGVCAKEFDRGYAFGARDSYTDIMKLIVKHGGAVGEDFQQDEILLRIPREVFIILDNEVKKNL